MALLCFFFAGIDFVGAEYTCNPDTTILGTADVKLSNGKTEDRGYSISKCEHECSANAACKGFVLRGLDGSCKMWSRTTGTSKVGGMRHCVKPGEHA